MLKYLKAFFYPAVITFSYNQRKELVIAKIMEVLNENVSLFSNNDMAGRFLSQDSFAIHLVHPAFVRGARLSPTLVGKILESSEGVTAVSTLVKPVFALYAMFFATPVLAVFYCWKFSLAGLPEYLVSTILLLLLGPALSVSFFHVAKSAIRQRYMMYIDKALVSL